MIETSDSYCRFQVNWFVKMLSKLSCVRGINKLKTAFAGGDFRHLSFVVCHLSFSNGFSHGLRIILVLCLYLPGCVERYITIDTTPSNAIVWLNGEEVGASPVTVPFLWYGSYQVEIRRHGFQTLKTARHAHAPIYQWPVIDFFAECLLPVKFTDHHHWEFELTPQTLADPNSLLNRAQSLRQQTEIIRSPNP